MQFEYQVEIVVWPSVVVPAMRAADDSEVMGAVARWEAVVDLFLFYTFVIILLSVLDCKI